MDRWGSSVLNYKKERNMLRRRKQDWRYRQPMATVPLTKELINWADEIYVMEFKHQQAVLEMVPTAWKKVESLEIPDVYYREQPELKRVIIEKMKPYMKR